MDRVVSRPDFDRLRRLVRAVPAVAASSPVSTVLNDGTAASVVFTQAVTGNYFATVRLPIAYGRGIQDVDDRPGGDPVVVLSHQFWQSKTGGNRALIGRTVRIGGHPFVVIGVVAESVQNARDLTGGFGLVNADAWIPLSAKGTVTGVSADRDDLDLTVITRVPASTSVRTLSAEIGGIGAALDQSLPLGGTAVGPPAMRSWSAVTVAEIAREQGATTTKVGSAVVLLVSLVLVVACTNIANLAFGRGVSRQHELAIRRALGASRIRLIREQCAESVVLAVLGGVGALVVARILIDYLATDIPLGNAAVVAVRPTLNAHVLLVATGALLVSTLVFGVIPAMQLVRASVREQLAGDAMGAAPSRWRGRRGLIVWQVAISTGLMLIAFASTRVVIDQAQRDPGFDLRRLAVGSVSFRPMHWDAPRVREAIASIDTAARRQAGFTSVALTTGLPLGSGVRVLQLAQISAANQSSVSQERQPVARVVAATPAVFRTLGLPILRGRGFDDHDTSMTPPVIVISEHVARQFLGTTDAVGRQMKLRGPSDTTLKTVEVIGITKDTDSLALFDRSLGVVYVPLAQQNAQAVLIVGRTVSDPAPMVRSFAGIVRQADPDLAVEFAATGPMVMTPTSVILRIVAVLAGGLSLLAVTLAMVGLYGALSHVVARRTREIGVRLALGAEGGRIRRMVVVEGLSPVVWGLGIGLLVGIGARLVLRATSTAEQFSVGEPFGYGLAAVTLCVAGFAASYLPARRASRVDPNVALRDL